MGLIAAVIATALCAVVYVRMYQRELPEPIGKRQAAIPVGFGVISVLLTLPLLVLIALGVKAVIGGSIADVVPNPVLSSLIRSFFLAGFTEEIIKFGMFLIVIRLVKPKNVYEYGFLCAGVGFGFTGLEDLYYGLQNPVGSVFRVLFFAMHMMFGLLMGIQLGLAAYSKRRGRNDAGTHMALALGLPVLWHTVFDASTTTNAAINSDDRTVQIIGLIIAIAVCLISIAMQFVLLIQFKNRVREYCGMRTDGGVGERHAARTSSGTSSTSSDERKSQRSAKTGSALKLPTLSKGSLRVHRSTARILLAACTICAFVFTFAYTTAWGIRVDRLSAISSTDVFKKVDLEIIDGGHFTEENLKDARVTLFNVWGTSCSPCIAEMPDLEKLGQSYEPGQIQIVGLVEDAVNANAEVIPAKAAEAQQIMDKAGATFPSLLMDMNTYAFVKTNVAGTPTTFFVDENGTILHTVTGRQSFKQWKKSVDEVLATL